MPASFAKLLSFIFNPIILLLVIPFLLLNKLNHDFIAAVSWTGYTFGFLVAMTVFLAYMVQRGTFSDMDVSRREQRPLLYAVSALFVAVYVAGLFYFQAPRLMFAIALGVFLGVVFGSIINTRLKASIHVATITALIFALAVIYNGYYLLTLLFIPLVAWARIKIKRHTLPETIVGGLLGILLSLCVYGLYNLLFEYL